MQWERRSHTSLKEKVTPGMGHRAALPVLEVGVAAGLSQELAEAVSSTA